MFKVLYMKKKVFLLLAVLWTGFIFSNSLQVGEDSAQMSGFIVNIVMSVFGKIGITDIGAVSFIVRKTAHFTEFFIQSILMSLSVYDKKYRGAAIYVLFLGLFTACCDELLQFFTDGRDSLVRDVFIDFGGTVCAAAVFGFLKLFCKKHFTKLN